MSGAAQEQEERFYLDKFLDALGLHADSIDRGADPPDLVLTESGRAIAVEVKGFHSAATGDAGHPRRAVEEEWDALRETISTARRAHPELDSINCHLSFRGLLVPPRRQHVAFADELIRLVQEKSGQVAAASLECTDLTCYPLLQEYLEGVDLSRPGCYMMWNWDLNAACVGLSEEELKGVILPKLRSQKPADVAENWLLVVSGLRLSQSMGLPHVEELGDYRCLNKALAQGPLDRVYVFQYAFGRILEWSLKEGWVEVRPAKWAT